MVKKAFDGLESLQYIKVTRKGYFDRKIQEGSPTKYTSTKKLREIFKTFEPRLLKEIKPDLDAETILLRNTIEGRKLLVDYDDTSETNS